MAEIKLNLRAKRFLRCQRFSERILKCLVNAMVCLFWTFSLEILWLLALSYSVRGCFLFSFFDFARGLLKKL